MYNVKTNKSWQRYQPKRAKRMRAYFPADKQLFMRRVIRIFWAIVFILLVQSIFQWPYLAVDNIVLSGNKDLTIDDVKNTINDNLNQHRFIFFKNNNFFILNTKPLADKLKETYNLEGVMVNKKWPDKLIIDIKEKVSHFVWQKADTYYLLDATGAKIRQISASDSKYLLIDDQRSRQFSDNQVFSQAELDMINKIYTVWQEKIGSKATLYKLTMVDSSNMDLYTLTGYFVKIDTKGSIETQLNNLDRVLKSGISGQDVNYIDVRFGDKVYFN